MNILDYFKVKLFIPFGMSDKAKQFLSSEQTLSNGTNILFVHFLANKILSPFYSSQLPFGVAVLGWAQPEYHDHLQKRLEQINKLTITTGDEFISGIGLGNNVDHGSYNIWYGMPLLDISEAERDEQYMLTNPLSNSDRTSEIVNWCLDYFIGGALEKEPLGIIYCVCSNLQEISDRKIDELEALLTSEIEN